MDSPSLKLPSGLMTMSWALPRSTSRLGSEERPVRTFTDSVEEAEALRVGGFQLQDGGRFLRHKAQAASGAGS